MVVSKYVYFLSKDKKPTVIWHSIYGRVMQIPKDLAIYLKEAKEFNKENFTKTFDIESYDFLKKNHILIESAKEDDNCLKKLFEVHNVHKVNKVKYLSLIMSEECPFRCSYCIHFANSKHYYNKEKMMSFDTAKLSIDNYILLLINKGERDFYINFGGGEPLLNYATISKLLPYIKECEKRYGIHIKIGINTNLALLTEEIAKSLISYNVEIAASLDGARAGNDKVRLTKDLQGTYDLIIKGFTLLSDLGHPLDGFAMTVTEENLSEVNTDIIDWAYSLGMTEIRIDIDVVGIVKTPIREIVNKLIYVRKYANRKGISVIGFWSRPAENLGLIPEEEDIGFCGGERGNSICVTPSGDVLPCGYSNYQMGAATEILEISKNKRYQALLSNRNLERSVEKCKRCPIFGFCRGGCLITREANGEFSEKESSMCELYVEMTKEIIFQQIET